MYVNAWQESNQKLHVEYGSHESGCSKIDSNDIVIEYDVWYHVAMYTTNSIISLYINGELVNTKSLNSDTSHQVQSESNMMIGNMYECTLYINRYYIYDKYIDRYYIYDKYIDR